MRLALFIFVTFAIVITASAKEVISCNGSIKAFATSDGRSMRVLNEKTDTFSISEDDALFIFFGSDPKKPFVRVAPWGTPLEKIFKNNFEKELDLSYKTDGLESFTITVRSKRTRFSESLSCTKRFVASAEFKRSIK